MRLASILFPLAFADCVAPIPSGIAHVVEDPVPARSFVALDESSEPRRLSGVRTVEVVA